MLCGIIIRQSNDVLHDPFANAFNKDDSGDGHQGDKRFGSRKERRKGGKEESRKGGKEEKSLIFY
jgi:hypothetical protein